MSDELRELLRDASRPRPGPFNPCLRGNPRVHGGLSLQGGPTLEIDGNQSPTTRTEPSGDDAPSGDTRPQTAHQAEPTPPTARTTDGSGAQQAGSDRVRHNDKRHAHENHAAQTGPGATAGPHMALSGGAFAGSPNTTSAPRPGISDSARSALAPSDSPQPDSPQPATEARSTEDDHLAELARRAAQHRLASFDLRKSYHKGSLEVPVLRGVELTVDQREMLCIVGQSGSGKSTLLHLLGTLDAPDEGQIYFDGRRIDNLPGRARDRLRNRRFGMIFQFYHLLPELTTLENVLSPLMIAHGVWGYLRRRRELRRRAEELLEMVGLSHRLRHKPRELSGGEMQRTAIARALIGRPEVLLADEPTGNLDHATGREILTLLRTLNDDHGLTIVMVTHDSRIADQSDRTLHLVDGRVAA